MVVIQLGKSLSSLAHEDLLRYPGELSRYLHQSPLNHANHAYPSEQSRLEPASLFTQEFTEETEELLAALEVTLMSRIYLSINCAPDAIGKQLCLRHDLVMPASDNKGRTAKGSALLPNVDLQIQLNLTCDSFPVGQ